MRSRFYFTLIAALAAQIALAQPPDTYQAGTTWSTLQHNLTVGRMVAVCDGGTAQVVWMNGLNANQSPRHVYWNVWEPELNAFREANGFQVNASARAGYATIASDENCFGYPAFHEQLTGTGESHCAAGMDFFSAAGAFTTTQPVVRFEDGFPMILLWPKISYDANLAEPTLHVVSANSDLGAPMGIYYSRGTPIFDDFGSGIEIEWTHFGDGSGYLPLDISSRLSHDVANSPLGNRVAVAYTKSIGVTELPESELSNDVYVLVSADGGETWLPPRNITHFIPPDLDCFEQTGDWRCCSRDSLRAFGDLSIMFDDADVIHVAFTTIRYFRFDANGETSANPRCAQIWHWSEATDSITLVAEEWQPESTVNLGVNRAIVQKPSLALESGTNDLFCAYLRYDLEQLSDAGFPNADVWISRSANGGLEWTQGNNVTQTTAPPNAPSGQNASERDPSLALRAHDARLYLFYQFYTGSSGDAGEEATLSMMRMQRISTLPSPPEPLMPPRVFHITPQPCGATETVGFVPIAVHEFDAPPGRIDFLRAGDLDDDNYLELVFASRERAVIGMIWQHEDGEAEYRELVQQYDGASSVDIADLDNDDDPDIAISSLSGRCGWLENAGPDNFIYYELADDEAHPVTRIVATDILADGDLDLVCSTNPGLHVAAFYNEGSRNFTSGTLIQIADCTAAVVYGSANINGGPFNEFICASPTHGWITYLPGNVFPQFHVQARVSPDFGWVSHAAGADMNGDSLIDVVASSAARGRIHWWENLGVSFDSPVEFAEHQVTRNLPWVSEFTVRDLDIDGDSDIVACASEGYDVVWFENDGHGRFERHDLDAGMDGIRSLVATDLDGDVDIDVIVAGDHGIRWIENGAERDSVDYRPLDSDELAHAPGDFRIDAYPNPFNSSAVIRYEMPLRMRARVQIFDVLGRQVATLHDGSSEAGVHELEWKPDRNPTGLYFVRMNAGERMHTTKILYLK